MKKFLIHSPIMVWGITLSICITAVIQSGTFSIWSVLICLMGLLIGYGIDYYILNKRKHLILKFYPLTVSETPFAWQRRNVISLLIVMIVYSALSLSFLYIFEYQSLTSLEEHIMMSKDLNDPRTLHLKIPMEDVNTYILKNDLGVYEYQLSKFPFTNKYRISSYIEYPAQKGTFKIQVHSWFKEYNLNYNGINNPATYEVRTTLDRYHMTFLHHLLKLIIILSPLYLSKYMFEKKHFIDWSGEILSSDLGSDMDKLTTELATNRDKYLAGTVMKAGIQMHR